MVDRVRKQEDNLQTNFILFILVSLRSLSARSRLLSLRNSETTINLVVAKYQQLFHHYVTKIKGIQKTIIFNFCLSNTKKMQ